MFGDTTIQKVTDVVIESLKRELRDQGHHMTGELEESIRQILTNKGRKKYTDVVAVEYIKELNEGVPKEKIPDHPQYVLAMIRYVQKRTGASFLEAVQMGNAIARKHLKEGMPTEASKVWSNTGERTRFVEAADKQSEFETDIVFEEEIDNEMDLLILSSFDKIKF